MSAQRKDTRSKPEASENQPQGALLGTLAAFGSASALWALFQWSQLLISRMGGTSFCSISETFDCNAVWDSPFASNIHSATGVPVAGWGLVWGLVALVLPLLGLVRRAEGRSVARLSEAIVVTAATGAATVVIMAIASAADNKLCITCLGTYAVVLAYGAAAWRLWKQRGLPPLVPGVSAAVGLTVVFYLMLLLPGLRTPQAGAQEGTQHLPPATAGSDPTAAAPAQGAAPSAAPQVDASDPRAVVQGVNLVQYIASLPREARQGLSDSLHIYRKTATPAAFAPRVLEGPSSAPVRITDFTDILCGHCATLRATLHMLKERLPAGSFAVESRYFPLDGGCNELIKSPGKLPVRCLAAKAQICMERNAGREAYTSELFSRQKGLTQELVYSLAEPYMNREQLQQCMQSEQTSAKLQEDIRWAGQVGIDGTPLVLVNGRRGTSFAPFLYTITLTGGNPNHPAFAALPPPNPRAHLH